MDSLTSSQSEVVELEMIESLVTLITFDNTHLVAQMLSNTDPVAARALYEELAYWASNNKI